MTRSFLLPIAVFCTLLLLGASTDQYGAGAWRKLKFMRVLSVPGDYTTIQKALDSAECGRGTGSSIESQGCTIRLAPGVYDESFEIGGTAAQGNAYAQNSIIIEGAGPGGAEDGSGGHPCSVTLTGDNTANNSVIKINRAIGVTIRNLCISMDDGATNDPKFGIWIGYEQNTTKFIEVDHVSFDNGTVAGGAGIMIGNSGSGGAHTDSPFVILKQIKMYNMKTCLIVDSQQSVGMALNGLECSSPTAAIGGISIASDGGEIIIRDFYMSSGAASQTGINILNNAIGTTLVEHTTFEWDDDDGTLLNFDSSGGTGSGRTVSIIGGRFQVQGSPTAGHSATRKCIDWNRVGTLNVIGVSFESDVAGASCSVDLNNPSATKPSWVNWIGNDVLWASTFTEMVFNETTSGGPLWVDRHRAIYATAAPVDGTVAPFDECQTGDKWLDKTNFKAYWCTDGATNKWYGVALVDTP